MHIFGGKKGVGVFHKYWNDKNVCCYNWVIVLLRVGLFSKNTILESVELAINKSLFSLHF